MRKLSQKFKIDLNNQTRARAILSFSTTWREATPQLKKKCYAATAYRYFRNGLQGADIKRRNCDRRPSKLDFRNSQSPRIWWDPKLITYVELDPKTLSDPDPDLGWELRKSDLENPPTANPPVFLVRASAIGLNVAILQKCELKLHMPTSENKRKVDSDMSVSLFIH